MACTTGTSSKEQALHLAWSHSLGEPCMAPNISNLCGDAVEEGCDPLDEVVELDVLSEISEPLRLKRYDLKRKINQFHSPIVRQLFPDVMSIIFEFCLPNFAEPSTNPSSIPLALGSICSRWREIAWSTPGLWSSLVVCVSGKLDSHMATTSSIMIAQEWLARSGQLPLSIRIFSKRYSSTVLAPLAAIILLVGPILTFTYLSIAINFFMQPTITPLYSKSFDFAFQSLCVWRTWSFT